MADEPGDGRRTEAGSGAGKPFDPRPHLRRIRARGQEADYLDVKWRLAWLRTEHPDARITTEDIRLTESQAVFRATVEIPGGGQATGYGSETRDDFTDFIEKAETKAIGRALAALGYGTQFALDFDLEAGAPEGPRSIADAPVERAPRPEPQRPRIVPRAAERPPEAGPHVPDIRQAEPAEAPPDSVEPERGDDAREPEPEPEPFDAADYSWNEFWRWAKPLGYHSRPDLDEVLGVSTAPMTPREIRRRLIEHRRDQGLDS